MGSGVSTALLEAKECKEKASALFALIDGGVADTVNDGKVSKVELYDVLAKDGTFSLSEITEIIEKFDSSGDGYLSYDEFLRALQSISKTKKSKKNKRGFKFGEVSVVGKKKWGGMKAANQVDGPDVHTSAYAKPQSEEEKTAHREKMKDLYWKAQTELPIWRVPFGASASMPWLGTDSTGFESAMDYARTLKKTPLVIDNTATQIVDKWFYDEVKVDGKANRTGWQRAEELDAFRMFEDERKGKSHDEVMKKARKQLVNAMRTGVILYLRLDDDVVDFTGGGYTGEDTLPIGIFNQTVVDDLEPYVEGYVLPPMPDHVLNDVDKLPRNKNGLWQSRHPFAKALRENDLDNQGNFFVKKSFKVVVCTFIPEKRVVELLRNSMPWQRIQPIFVTDKPIEFKPKEEPPPPKVETGKEFTVIINNISVANVPKGDKKSESDPYMRFTLKNIDKSVESGHFETGRTEVLWDTVNPTFAHMVQMTVPAGSPAAISRQPQLELLLFDKDVEYKRKPTPASDELLANGFATLEPSGTEIKSLTLQGAKGFEKFTPTISFSYGIVDYVPPEMTLTIKMVRAYELPTADSPNKSLICDPYLTFQVLEVEQMDNLVSTPTKWNTTNPEWTETFTLKLLKGTPQPPLLAVQLWDTDKTNSDDPIATADVRLARGKIDCTLEGQGSFKDVRVTFRYDIR